MTMSNPEWAPQHVSIVITPCYGGRIRMEIASLEQGLDRRIFFTAEEWEHFKSAGDQMMRKARHDDA